MLCLPVHRYLEDGDLSIDNNHTERSLRGIAVGRRNWTFVGSDRGGKTMAVLRSFFTSCETGEGGPVRLVSGRAHAHRGAIDPAVRRIVAPPLGRESGRRMHILNVCFRLLTREGRSIGQTQFVSLDPTTIWTLQARFQTLGWAGGVREATFFIRMKLA